VTAKLSASALRNPREAAEVVALGRAGKLAVGGTAVVTLEPWQPRGHDPADDPNDTPAMSTNGTQSCS